MLSCVLPKDEISKKFQEKILFQEFFREDIDKIIKITPSTCHQLGLTIWNEIVQKKIHPVNPQEIAKYVQKGDPKLHKKIANIIRRPVVHELYYGVGKLQEGAYQDPVVCELFIAHIYPNTFYLADILLQNPKKPIDQAEMKFQHQTHEGLGLLPMIMEKIESVSVEHRFEQISLTAATIEHVPLFEKYGFKIQDSEAGRLSQKYGVGIPMERPL